MKTINVVLSILLTVIVCASCANLKYSGENEIEKINVEQGDCSIHPCWNEGVCRTDGKTNFCDCKPPYAGKFCEKRDCSRNPCKNGGVCVTQGDDIFCDCKPNFYGTYCAQRCLCENGYCEKNRENVFVVEYFCKCPPEYAIYTEGVCEKCDCGEGSNCTWEVTMYDLTKYCKCKEGYFRTWSTLGETCKADCRKLPCKNGGECISLGIGERSYCDCKAPFFGGYCENHPNSCFSNPCQNGGKCENYKSNYKCSCKNGYTGHDCETDPDPCNPNPCKNNGKCKNDDGKHKCLCIYGYTGNECETAPDPCNSNPCKYNGKCENHDGEYLCFCENGYTGPQCEAVDYCVSNPCQNGGTCRNGKYTFKCTCTEIYRGSNCSENVWCEKYGQDLCGKEKCQYNETLETGFCVCENYEVFHEGSRTCIFDNCASHPCQNGGSCRNGRLTFDCTCAGNYRGKDCSENIWCEKYGKKLCNNAKCEYDETAGSGYCVCENGKIFHETLKTCIDPCDTNPCKNNGKCVNDGEKYMCYCKNGYTGHDCETEDGGCSVYQCRNGGICTDKGEGPTCYCKFAFSGVRCERDYRYMIAVILLLVLFTTVGICGGFYLFRKKQKLLLRDTTGGKTLSNKPI